jgi:hypothetical protein
VGAVLRGELSANYELTMAIVHACGVTADAIAAWDEVWRRLGRPLRNAMDRRRSRLAYAWQTMKRNG